ncbi:hypothetical protein [Epilithonimonas hungarica]|uniref:Uncharacterized protein n=1 Tax=Epilithonimonas hungarica TaxID=454006 RepID=A0A1G7F841_9FLAO|nr:hypothetical protein [Epilithonimonas hungarica]SDE72039.1 hypothetical protein SAMN05421825_0009 [Epilithonimonas hungarica]
MWKEEKLEFTDEEINSLIKSSFSDSSIEKIASSRSENLRRKDQLEEFQSVVEDIKLAFKLYSGLQYIIFSYYVYCENGEILIKENAYKTIEETYSYYISTAKEIDLYNRHKKIIEELNSLSEDIRKNTGASTITSAWLVNYNLDGTTFAPSTFKYGK